MKKLNKNLYEVFLFFILHIILHMLLRLKSYCIYDFYILVFVY